jgi:hypothetical protein
VSPFGMFMPTQCAALDSCAEQGLDAHRDLGTEATITTSPLIKQTSSWHLPGNRFRHFMPDTLLCSNI